MWTAAVLAKFTTSYMANRGSVHRGDVQRGSSAASALAPPTHDDDDDNADSDDQWEDGGVEDWDEPEDAPTRCLFTDQEFASPAECLAHAASSHALDLNLLIGRLKLDLYDKMKLVNFLRTSLRTPGADVAAVVATVVACQPGAPESWPWSEDTYLQPVLADDPLLYSLSMGDDEADEAEEQADALEAVGALHETVALMRQEMRAMLSGLDDVPARSSARSSEADADADADGGAAASAQAPAEATAAEGPTEGEYGTQAAVAGSSYFGSYSRFGIHQEMLQDTVRTEAYREAIVGNAALLEGKVVLDVGCGTGILSLFAAKAGARLVIGVDASDILQSARKVVEANGMQDRIKLVQSTLETLDLAPLLPEGVEKVDVIISEWMGYLLLYESMLPSVLYARDKWLAPGGHLLPSSCEMRICASSHDRLGFWGEVYGYDMSAVREEARKETLADAAVELVPAASLLSPSAAFRSVHMAQAQDAELDFTTDFALAASTPGTLRCFAVHFDTLFDLQPVGGQTSGFSTAPDCPPTHWKQVALYLESPRELQPGDRMSGSISCARRKDNKRAYDVSVTFAINGAACGTQLWRVC